MWVALVKETGGRVGKKRLEKGIKGMSVGKGGEFQLDGLMVEGGDEGEGAGF